MVGNTNSARASTDDNGAIGHDTTFTQNTATHNIATKALYLELLGSAGVYAFCYDTPVTQGINLRVGFSGWYLNQGIRSGQLTLLMAPVMLVHTIGTTHQMEIGVGIVPYYINGMPDTFGRSSFLGGFSAIPPVSAYPVNERISAFRISNAIGVLGYRYMPSDHGVMWKISLMPVFVDKSLRPYLSIGVGYAW